jgi:membrane fusion protein (multidrug efflux system)
VLPSAQSPAKPVLTTSAYAKQLHDADALIERIIDENLPGRPAH